MRPFFTTILFLIAYPGWSQQVALSQSNFSSCPSNGIYEMTGTDLTGRNIYERVTNQISYVNKIRIIFNAAQNKWQIELQLTFGGWMIAGTNANPSQPLPPEAGWLPNEYYESTVPVTTQVYEPKSKTASCNNCNWSDPASWTPAGGIPRPYDNAIIDGTVLLDTDKTINNLTVNESRSLTQSSQSTLDVYGELALDGQLNVQRLLLRKGTSLNGARLVVRQLKALGTLPVVLESDLNVYDQADPGNGQYSVTGSFKLGEYNLTTFGGMTDSGVDRSDVNAQTDGSGRIRYYFKAGDTYSRGFKFNGYSLSISGVANNGSDKPFVISAKTSSVFTHPLPSEIGYIPCQWDISSELIDTNLEHYFGILFLWPQSVVPAGFNVSNAYVKRWNGVDWENKAGPLNVASSGVYVSGISEFSSWGIFDSEVVLPVQMVSFTATIKQNVVELSWITAQESNSDHFEIEHSLDAKVWKSVGRLSAMGESKIRNRYTYSHLSIYSGIQYYRIKSVDRDDTFAYSSIRSVKSLALPVSYLYPNPVGDWVLIGGSEGVRSATLTTGSGALLGEIKSNAECAFDVKRLLPGRYILQFKDQSGYIRSLPFIKF